MRTSLNNIREIEDYLFLRMNSAEKAAFKRRIALEPMLRINVMAQRMVYRLVRAYGRRKTRMEVDIAYRNFRRDPLTAECRRKIGELFSNP